jgi:hypothetical protein
MCLGESVDHACIVVTLQARLTRWAQQEQSRAFGRMSDAIQEEAKNGKTGLRDAWRQAYVEQRPQHAQLSAHLQQFVHTDALCQSADEQERYMKAAIAASEDPATEKACKQLYCESVQALKVAFDAVVPDHVKKAPERLGQWERSERTEGLELARATEFAKLG